MNRVCAVLLCLVLSPIAWAQAPVGGEFLVNTYTTGSQIRPDVAMDTDGNFVVVWIADDSTVGPGLVGQRFDPRGVPRGGEFQVVGPPTAGWMSGAVIAMAADGRFVVAWNDGGRESAGGYGVFARRFGPSGTPMGVEFQVNTYTTGIQVAPQVASDDEGNFVVVWQSQAQDFNGYGVFAHRFDANGSSLGGEFMVHSATHGLYGIQSLPTVDADADGNFVVAWQNSYQEIIFGPLVHKIAARRFDSDGVALGGEFRVTTPADGSLNRGPQVARDGAGNFVVAWSAGGGGFPIPSGAGVVARSFDAAGNPITGTFSVPTSSGSQYVSDIDADRQGRFIVAWDRRAAPVSFPDVLAQVVDLSGAKLGPELQVNSFTTGNQRIPAVASARDENFVVVWESKYQDGGNYGVYAQRYGDLIFRNGFEAAGS